MHPEVGMASINSRKRSFILAGSSLGFFGRRACGFGGFLLRAMSLHFRCPHFRTFDQAVARIVDYAVAVGQAGEDLDFLAEIASQLHGFDMDNVTLVD